MVDHGGRGDRRIVCENDNNAHIATWLVVIEEVSSLHGVCP